jgi:plasmid replication initiation protein
MVKKKKKKNQDIVRYHNDMNQVYFGGITTREWDLFMALCVRLLSQDTNVVKFTFEQLTDMLGYRFESNEELANTLKRFLKKLNSSVLEQRDKTGVTYFSALKKIHVDLKTGSATVSVNSEFTWVLNELTGSFTSFELVEFVQLRSKYAKSIYRLCRQWSKTQTYTQMYDVDDFRHRLDIPESYGWENITPKIIKPAFKELSQFFGKMTLHKHRRHRKIDKVFISFERKEFWQIPELAEQLKVLKKDLKYYESQATAARFQDTYVWWAYTEMVNATKSKIGKIKQQLKHVLF